MSRLTYILAADDYDADFLPPSPAVVALAETLLADLPARSESSLYLAPIGDGGVCAEWQRDGDYVRLLIPPQPERAYIYWRRGAEKGLLPALPVTLYASLLELLPRPSP